MIEGRAASLSRSLVEPDTNAGRAAIADFDMQLGEWIGKREPTDPVRIWLVEMRRPILQFVRSSVLLAEREARENGA